MDVAIIGAGIGGLSAAVECAAAGLAVTVFEKERRPGGKMRRLAVGNAEIDAGPTVFTKRAVFDALFERAGGRLGDHLTVTRCETIARHVFSDGAVLDLFDDRARSREAIAAFAGARAAREFDAFMARARETLRTLDPIFMEAPKPSGPLELTLRAGFKGAWRMARIGAHQTLAAALAKDFSDPRLCALFGRYATYVGSSPYSAPATLRLIAAVESEGVWRIEGGMTRLAEAVEALARRIGVRFVYGDAVEEIEVAAGQARGLRLASGARHPADVVIANCDADALARGLFGKDAAGTVDRPLGEGERSLSALTIAVHARTGGLPLLHHNVFFGANPAAEFDAIFRDRRLPADPTVYVCAGDRGTNGLQGGDGPQGPERLFLIVNAPPTASGRPCDQREIETCVTAAFSRLRSSGLTVDLADGDWSLSTPSDYAALFPGTGGALYGRASHGSTASFQRPGARTRLKGLYLCGGSAHPGAGVPMASLSGSIAARALLADRASTSRSRRAAMPGGMSTRSPTTAGTA